MIRVEAHQDYRLGGDIIIVASDRGPSGIAAPSVTWSKAEEGSIMEPLLILDNNAAQVLMDSLWDCGVRPSAGHGSAGALAATERHLEDMRALQFGTHTISIREPNHGECAWTNPV